MARGADGGLIEGQDIGGGMRARAILDMIASGMDPKAEARRKRKEAQRVVVNTSFNVRGEPIVCDAGDAFRCFMGTGIEMLVCGSTILHKQFQNRKLAEYYKSKHELD